MICRTINELIPLSQIVYIIGMILNNFIFGLL
jgi:hypothetical protein